ncbi:MAG TPA: hypothetical protein VN758_06010 [Solirubrobacterales bacterium]|nr:hypothetical protein [Solirubrobacterales bacterium]
MDRTLFVIVGAGASFDAAEEWPMAGFVRPPLVKDLFGRDYDSILARYRMARNAAPEIRDALRHGRDGEAISLETHLRSMYLNSNDPYDKRRFFEITLYLQDLLWQASSTERVHFDNTDRLVTILLRHFDHVCFITLNYDTILDQALHSLDSITSLDSYIDYGRWSLIKLHGSVNWGYRTTGDVSLDDPPANLDQHLGETIHLAEPKRFAPSSVDGPPRFAYFPGEVEDRLFPALTVPVGEEDEVVCPPLTRNFSTDAWLSQQSWISLSWAIALTTRQSSNAFTAQRRESGRSP